MDFAISEGAVSVAGGKVWYRHVGCDRPGIPLLVLHGGPRATHDYLEPLQGLATERPVIFYDQLGGAANSDRPDDPALWQVSRFVDKVAAVRTALGLNELHILGQSWGTMLAVEYLTGKKSAGVKCPVLSAPFLSAPRWVADQRAYLAQMPDDIRQAVQRAETLGDFDAPEYQER